MLIDFDFDFDFDFDLDTHGIDCYRQGAECLRVVHPFARDEAVSLVSVALGLSAAQLFVEVPET